MRKIKFVPVVNSIGSEINISKANKQSLVSYAYQDSTGSLI